MVSAEKLASYSFILIGIVFLLEGIGTIYLVITLGGILETIRAAGAVTGAPVPSFTSYIIGGWVFGLLLTITGIVTLISGVAVLVQK